MGQARAGGGTLNIGCRLQDIAVAVQTVMMKVERNEMVGGKVDVEGGRLEFG